MDSRFEALYKALETKMELPEGFKPLLAACIQEAGYNSTPVSSGLPVITMKPTAKGGHRTGYNVFQTQRNAELKTANVDNSMRQGQIVSEWRAMGEEDKKKWNAIAAGGNPTGSTTAPTKRMSGWNLYMKTEMAARKGKIGKGEPAPLKAIGAAWKAMPKVDQEKWNTMAKEGIAPTKVESKPVVDPSVNQEEDEEKEEEVIVDDDA